MKNKKQTLFILCGEAFSGKSTLAKKIAEHYNAKIVGRDAAYFALEEIFALDGTPDEEDREMWDNLWPIAIQGAYNQLLLRNSVVFDDTSFRYSQRDDLRLLAEKNKAKIILIYLKIPAGVLKERRKKK